MTDIRDLETKRKDAYAYIKSMILSRRHVPANAPDVQLADALGGTIELTDSLRLLKEGIHNPTKRLVEAFKREFKSEIPESTIDSHLVDPFKTK